MAMHRIFAFIHTHERTQRVHDKILFLLANVLHSRISNSSVPFVVVVAAAAAFHHYFDATVFHNTNDEW